MICSNRGFSLAPLILFFVSMCMIALVSAVPAWALFAYTADSYEKTSAFDSIGTVLILPPKVVTGDFQLHRNEPVSEDNPANQLIKKSVLIGAAAAFSQIQGHIT